MVWCLIKHRDNFTFSYVSYFTSFSLFIP